uniref:Glycosyltransferase family 92 protein n=1 Tax=Enterobius vermicularis TaxID=51028 RepID=A0A0N4VRI6_ENTVE
LSYFRCTYFGQYGVANRIDPDQVKKVLNKTEELYVFLNSHADKKKSLRLIDSRLGTRQHKLAVCPAPILHYAEWTVLPQFFEMWIEHGATKFYLYHHSISPEVDALFRIYENDPRIDIERVPYGIIPVPENSSETEDVNQQIFGGEQVFAWNDCIIRSRGKTKYIALVDFDEVFVVLKNQSFLSVLENGLEAEPATGAFVFRSTPASYKHTYSNVTHPTQITFDNYGSIQVERRTFPAGIMSKVVVIPERILSTNVHLPWAMEAPFTEKVISPETSKILHLRCLSS